MDNFIVHISNLITGILLFFILVRVILFNYLQRASNPTFIDNTFPILSIRLLLPIRRSESLKEKEKKLIRVANLALYLFYATLLILIIVLLYGRQNQLLFII